MGSRIGRELSIIGLFAIASYLCILGISVMFYHMRHPDLINNIKQSITMAVIREAIPIVIWLMLAIIYWYSRSKGHDVEHVAINNDKRDTQNEGYLTYCVWVLWKQRILAACIIITMVLLHAQISIKKTTAQHSSLCYNFKTGKNQHANHVDTNYDRSWPGWSYYYSDSYYTQTKERLQTSRAKLIQLKQYEKILLALKDVNEGIYSTRSWLTNHRMIYDLIRISCGFIGSLIVGTMWVVWGCGRVCGKGWAYRGLKVCLFGAFWLLMPILGIFGELSQSLVLMNNNQVCLPKPNSGVVVITINSNSVNRISQLKLTVVEDPNNIYSNVCLNMQKYYEKPIQSDIFVIKHVINVSLIGFVWVFVCEILCMIYSEKISNYKPDRNSNKIGANEFNQITCLFNRRLKIER